MTQMCTNQMIDIICTGPSRPYFQKMLAQKLMNEHIQVGQRRIKTTEQQFDQLASVIFNIMNASRKGSAPKNLRGQYFVLVFLEQTNLEKHVNNLDPPTFLLELPEWKI